MDNTENISEIGSILEEILDDEDINLFNKIAKQEFQIKGLENKIVNYEFQVQELENEKAVLYQEIKRLAQKLYTKK